MDVMLQKHGAKHVYKVPEGLRELCTDIAREVLRSQPRDIYNFIADYVDTLLITRENAKVAVKVVNNILLGSRAIVNILYRTGLTLEQIVVAAPRIQATFRDYLDAVDVHPIQPCDDRSFEERSKRSLRSILENTGVSFEDAEKAATIIQAAFRGHYERMLLSESEGKIQWQRAVMNTLDIMKKAGISQEEAAKTVSLIKVFEQLDYLNSFNHPKPRNNRPLTLSLPIVVSTHDETKGYKPEKTQATSTVLGPTETIQAVAWMDMMYKDSGLTFHQANEAAFTIQRAYRKYQKRRRCYDMEHIESTSSMVVEAIVENVRQKVFDKVLSRENIPEEYGTREDMQKAGAKLQQIYKDHLRLSRISEKGELFSQGEEYGEEVEEQEGEEKRISKEEEEEEEK